MRHAQFYSHNLPAPPIASSRTPVTTPPPLPPEMCLKMPLVLGKHDKLLGAFKTGLGLSFDDTGIDHCQMHRHAVSVCAGVLAMSVCVRMSGNVGAGGA